MCLRGTGRILCELEERDHDCYWPRKHQSEPRFCCWLLRPTVPHHVSVLFNVVCVDICLCCVSSVVVSVCSVLEKCYARN